MRDQFYMVSEILPKIWELVIKAQTTDFANKSAVITELRECPVADLNWGAPFRSVVSDLAASHQDTLLAIAVEQGGVWPEEQIFVTTEDRNRLIQDALVRRDLKNNLTIVSNIGFYPFQEYELAQYLGSSIQEWNPWICIKDGQFHHM